MRLSTLQDIQEIEVDQRRVRIMFGNMSNMQLLGSMTQDRGF